MLQNIEWKEETYWKYDLLLIFLFCFLYCPLCCSNLKWMKECGKWFIVYMFCLLVSFIFCQFKLVTMLMRWYFVSFYFYSGGWCYRRLFILDRNEWIWISVRITKKRMKMGLDSNGAIRLSVVYDNCRVCMFLGEISPNSFVSRSFISNCEGFASILLLFLHT